MTNINSRKKRVILWLRIVSIALLLIVVPLTWSTPPLLSSIVFGMLLLHITALYLIERHYSRAPASPSSPN